MAALPLRLAALAALAGARPKHTQPTRYPTHRVLDFGASAQNLPTQGPTSLALVPDDDGAPTYAPTYAPTLVVDAPCPNTSPEWLASLGSTCALYVGDHPSRTCTKNDAWVANRYCEQTCFDRGMGYVTIFGTDCARDSAAAPPVPTAAPPAPAAAPTTRRPTAAPIAAPTRGSDPSAAPSAAPSVAPTGPRPSPPGAPRGVDPREPHWSRGRSSRGGPGGDDARDDARRDSSLATAKGVLGAIGVVCGLLALVCGLSGRRRPTQNSPGGAAYARADGDELDADSGVQLV